MEHRRQPVGCGQAREHFAEGGGRVRHHPLVHLEQEALAILEPLPEGVGVELLRHFNLDNVCWEGDFPHSDGIWPVGPETVEKVMAGLADQIVNKIPHQNAMRHFQFEPFKYRERARCTVEALRAEALDVELLVLLPVVEELELPHAARPNVSTAQLTSAPILFLITTSPLLDCRMAARQRTRCPPKRRATGSLFNRRWPPCEHSVKAEAEICIRNRGACG